LCCLRDFQDTHVLVVRVLSLRLREAQQNAISQAILDWRQQAMDDRLKLEVVKAFDFTK
jgi:hypothetical protein